jgi:hypothetical protein
MVVEADGKVGVGTQAPSTRMHIVENSTATALTVSNTSSNGTVVKLTSSGDNRNLYLQTDHIYSNGALYIGDGNYNTIIRGNELLVETNVRAQGHLYLNTDNSPSGTDATIYFGDDASDTAHYFQFDSSHNNFKASNSLETQGSLISYQGLYLNYDNTASDTYAYFGDSLSDTAHWLRVNHSGQEFQISNRVIGTAGRLGAIEYNGSDVDKVNFALSGSTLTITTS